MENITVTGRLVQPPQYHSLDDTSVVNLRLACSRGKVNKNGNPYTDYHSIVLWGKNAEVAHKYTTTGSLIGIDGRLENNNYKKEGKHYQREVVYGTHIELLETKQQTLAHKASLQDQKSATRTDDYIKRPTGHKNTNPASRDQPLSDTDDSEWFPFR